MPAIFFQNFEDATLANGENHSRWARLPYLSERSRQVYHTDVPDDVRDSKYRILSGLGDTLGQQQRIGGRFRKSSTSRTTTTIIISSNSFRPRSVSALE